MNMEYIQAPGSLMILGPHPSADAFNQQISSDGGLLDLSKCIDAVKIEFLPVASRIDSIVRLWTRDPTCKEFFDRINAGFIVNSSLNAFADVHGRTNLLAINSGLVWQLHELWSTLFSHPEFLRDQGGERIDPPFDYLHSGFHTDYGYVGGSDNEMLWRSHPRPFNTFRLLMSLIMSQMSIEYVFYHELGHLICGHSAFLRDIDPLFRMNELEANRCNSMIDKKLFQTVEYDADGFAIQSSLGNGLMLNYFQSQESNPSNAGDLSPKEMAYYFWAMSLSGVMRLFSQHGTTITDHESSTHPHPLLRALGISMTVATSTALKDDPDRERIIDLCWKASCDLDRYWRKYEIPGYRYDFDEYDDLRWEAAKALYHAGKLLRNTYHERAKYENKHVSRIVCNGAHVDRSLMRPNKTTGGIHRRKESATK